MNYNGHQAIKKRQLFCTAPVNRVWLAGQVEWLKSRKPDEWADPPLSIREIARVRESARNIKKGRYRDFSSFDEMWKCAEC
jgi:hypothetical protein